MVAKMMKWSPWPAMATRKYKVKVKPVKLESECVDEGIIDDDEEEKDKNQKVMAIKVKWKGEPKFGLVPFSLAPKQRRDFSSEKMVKRLGAGRGAIMEWGGQDEEEFENVCSFAIVSTSEEDGGEKFGPWDVSFSVLYGEKKKKAETSKSKLAVIGRASLNIAEMAGRQQKKMMGMDCDHHQEVEAKLPIHLNFGGESREAILLVKLNFVEIRDLQVPNSVESSGQFQEEGAGPAEKPDQISVESTTFGVKKAAPKPSPDAQSESAKKMGIFSWKKRRLSFKPATMFEKEPSKNDKKHDLDQLSSGSSSVDSFMSGSPQPSSVLSLSESPSVEDEGAWELKEITSRDGRTKLKTSVFLASFDQCSNEAAGESACTALVAVVAHWLHVNRFAMPTKPEFDVLILEGSSEWRKLCENDAYTYDFPNKHFDLETVLHADVRAVDISRDDSFVGFFSPEKFECLKGAMSFDQIWDGIHRITEDDDDPRIYIVSWNDHFFVLKVEANAYYIIDTLGERLFEGCNQAFIMRFDDSSLMHGKSVNEEANKGPMSRTSNSNPCEDKMEMVCSGKECCKEFIKRFLAAIPILELEAEEKKGAVSYYSLHHRLQIELNSTCLLSSLKSSPFSSSSNLASSCSTDDCII